MWWYVLVDICSVVFSLRCRFECRDGPKCKPGCQSRELKREIEWKNKTQTAVIDIVKFSCINSLVIICTGHFRSLLKLYLYVDKNPLLMLTRQVYIKMWKFTMFISAVFVLFVIKLLWSKNKSLCGRHRAGTYFCFESVWGLDLSGSLSLPVPSPRRSRNIHQESYPAW